MVGANEFNRTNSISLYSLFFSYFKIMEILNLSLIFAVLKLVVSGEVISYTELDFLPGASDHLRVPVTSLDCCHNWCHKRTICQGYIYNPVTKVCRLLKDVYGLSTQRKSKEMSIYVKNSIDLCQSGPCVYGTCTGTNVTTLSFTCECDPGYQGERCDMRDCFGLLLCLFK